MDMENNHGMKENDYYPGTSSPICMQQPKIWKRCRRLGGHCECKNGNPSNCECKNRKVKKKKKKERKPKVKERKNKKRRPKMKKRKSRERRRKNRKKKW